MSWKSMCTYVGAWGRAQRCESLQITPFGPKMANCINFSFNIQEPGLEAGHAWFVQY